ncbi:unnamed protein product [Orchesella dallaii]|uniref:TAZ-type domain-containing protein n=1 Tax=Orchesella dallaii TaxID=48710 RepID=A0ABP1R3F2_9HEXA
MLPDDSPSNISFNADVGATAFPISSNGTADDLTQDDGDKILRNFFYLHRVKKWEKKRVDAEQKNLPPPAPLENKFWTKHVIMCKNANCNKKHCQSSKKLYEHWMLCDADECNTCCAPVASRILKDFLNYLRRNQMQDTFNELVSYAQARQHISPLKNVKGIISKLWDK